MALNVEIIIFRHTRDGVTFWEHTTKNRARINNDVNALFMTILTDGSDWYALRSGPGRVQFSQLNKVEISRIIRLTRQSVDELNGVSEEYKSSWETWNALCAIRDKKMPH